METAGHKAERLERERLEKEAAALKELDFEERVAEKVAEKIIRQQEAKFHQEHSGFAAPEMNQNVPTESSVVIGEKSTSWIQEVENFFENTDLSFWFFVG